MIDIVKNLKMFDVFFENDLGSNESYVSQQLKLSFIHEKSKIKKLM